MTSAPSVGWTELNLVQRGERLHAVSIRIQPAAVASTREVIRDVLLVDLDSEGVIVGIELLGPIILDQLKHAVRNADLADSLWRSLRARAPEFASAA